MIHARPAAVMVCALLVSTAAFAQQVGTGNTMQVNKDSHTSAKSQKAVVDTVNQKLADIAGPASTTPAAPAKPAAPATIAPATLAASGAVSTTALPVAGPLSPEDQRLWGMHWRSVAIKFAPVDKTFFYAPNWDPKYPSSLHLSLDTWTRENTKTEKRASGTMVQTISIVPPREEAIAAATTLPKVAVGQYGYIHSANVLEIKGPQEMIVTDIWFVDADAVTEARKNDQLNGDRLVKAAADEAQRLEDMQRRQQQQSSSGSSGTSSSRTNSRKTTVQPTITREDVTREIDDHYRQRDRLLKQQKADGKIVVRLLGFSTAGVAPGGRWTVRGAYGPQLVVVADPQTALVKPRPVSLAGTTMRTPPLTAVNGDLFRDGLPEADFRALLASAGMTDAAFVAQMKQSLRDTPKEAAVDCAQAIEEARIAAFQAEQARLAAEAQAAKARPITGTGAKPATAGASTTTPTTNAKSNWFQEKYGKKKPDGAAPADPKLGATDAPTPAAPAATAPKKTNWFEEKYAKKKADGDTKSDAPAGATK